MKKNIIILCFLFFVVNLQANYILKIKPDKQDKFQSEYSVVFKNKLKPLLNVSPKQDKLLRNDEFSNYYVASDLSENELDLMSKICEFIEPNYVYKIEQSFELPNDTRLQEQWALPAMNAFNAWKKATGKNVIVAVIDTGIDFEHDELKSQLWINSAEDLNGNGKFDDWSSTESRDGVFGDLNNIDDDGNGYYDDIIGYDLVDQSVENFGDFSTHDYLPADENSHGTIVSGVIAAKTNNNLGIAGIAYNSKIMTVRAFDATGNAESDDIANAIIYAVINGAKVINMSFGENYESYLIRDVIKWAYSQGAVMFASSGNNNWNLPHYPSDFQEVICVGAINPSISKYGFSNYGSTLDIVAPGQEILTTDVNNSYSSTNGTSLAAPYAAGVAALILENNPELSPAQVKSILQETAYDLGEPKWDVQYGSGLVNASAALDAFTGGKIEISFPDREQSVNKNTEKLAIIGSTASTFFNSYKIKIGEGIMPSQWQIETRLDSTSVLNDTLAIIDISNLKDTLYTLALEVNLTNQNSIEERIYLNFFSDNKIKFVENKVSYAYKDSRRIMIVSAETNKKSYFKIKYKAENDTKIYEKSEILRASSKHLLQINEPELQNKNIEIELIAYDNSGDSVIASQTKIYKDDNFPQDKFAQKDYEIKRSYVFEEAGKIYDDSDKSLIMNDISNVGFGKTYSYYFDGQEFITKDSSEASWLTVGYGDSNGDGIQEFFGTANQKVILTQASEKGGNPFEIELFKNSNIEIFWGAAFLDITGDGLDDLIGYDNSSYFVYSYVQGEYRKVATAVFPNDNITRGSAIGDFDNDGKIELYAVSSRGEIYIVEYQSDGTFRMEYENTNRDSDFNQYVAAGDFTGDGKTVFLHLSVGNKAIFQNPSNDAEQVWQAKIIIANGNDDYEQIASEIFAGVRAGFIPSLGVSYRNGVSAGDLDGDGNAEFVISAFPNLYVLTYKNNEVQPLWNYGSTLSNSAIIHDFDDNGINEIGFSTFGNMRFYEINEDFPLRTSAWLEGWAVNSTEAYLFWDKIDSATHYNIFSIEEQLDGSYLAISKAITDKPEVNISDLTPNREYLFAVTAFDLPENKRLSDFSELKYIYTVDAAIAEAAYFTNDVNIEINFNGLLGEKELEPSNFSLLNLDGFYLQNAISAVVKGKSKILLTIINDKLESGEYLLAIDSFLDYFNNPIKADKLKIIYEKVQPEKEIYLESLEILSASLIKLTFSEPITKESAELESNYILNPYGEIILASRDDFDSSAVLMNFSDVLRSNGARGKNYTITAQNIESATGNKITKGAGNTLGFVISQGDLESAYIYPNPLKYSENPEIYFAGLTPSAQVRVLSIDGYEHIVLNENDGNGGVEWDGRDKTGNKLQPGVYLFEVSDKSNATKAEKVLKKFVVLP